jgi:hypothetical protein
MLLHHCFCILTPPLALLSQHHYPPCSTCMLQEWYAHAPGSGRQQGLRSAVRHHKAKTDQFGYKTAETKLYFFFAAPVKLLVTSGGLRSEYNIVLHECRKVVSLYSKAFRCPCGVLAEASYPGSL